MGFMLPIIGPWLVKKGIKGGLNIAIQAGVVLLVIAAAWFLVINPIRNHLKHIHDLEKANLQLTADKQRLESQRDQLIELNRENERTRQLQQEIENSNERIAGEEREASTARARNYREIRDEIQRTPPATQPRTPAEPVAPVITNTLDRLWRQEGAGTGDQDSNPNPDGVR